ncbi:secretion protein [Roseateles chitinivorans]|uniref:Secretion protein n=1 Tax=Roseateles chitinivorans TaxID=2917965 RepID=A0A2G9C373_9BURK|nr:secretion protein [Roseateles chitinivorans]
MSASTYRIAADEQADIQLVDWHADPLVLELTKNGQVLALASPLNAAPGAALDDVTAAATSAPMADFEPRRFGDVVLCVGPADAAWPSDIELMERLMRPARAVIEAAAPVIEAATTGSRRVLAWGLVAALTLGGLLTTVIARHAQAARDAVKPEPLVGQVYRAISGAAIPEVTVRAAGDRVIVEGLLPDAAAAQALRQLLDRFPVERIEHRYASAADIAQSISEALDTPGLVVRYRDRGVFVVGGRAAFPDRVRDASTRVAADLAPLVRGIEVAVASAPVPDSVPVGAMLATDGLQYVQTRDGAKHLSLIPESIGELSDPPTPPAR